MTPDDFERLQRDLRHEHESSRERFVHTHMANAGRRAAAYWDALTPAERVAAAKLQLCRDRGLEPSSGCAVCGRIVDPTCEQCTGVASAAEAWLASEDTEGGLA